MKNHKSITYPIIEEKLLDFPVDEKSGTYKTDKDRLDHLVKTASGDDDVENSTTSSKKLN